MSVMLSWNKNLLVHVSEWSLLLGKLTKSKLFPLISEQLVVIIEWFDDLRMMLNNILGEAKADIWMIDVNINIRYWSYWYLNDLLISECAQLL